MWKILFPRSELWFFPFNNSASSNLNEKLTFAFYPFHCFSVMVQIAGHGSTIAASDKTRSEIICLFYNISSYVYHSECCKLFRLQNWFQKSSDVVWNINKSRHNLLILFVIYAMAKSKKTIDYIFYIFEYMFILSLMPQRYYYIIQQHCGCCKTVCLQVMF